MKRLIISSIKTLISLSLLWFLVHTSKLNFSLLPDLFNSPFLLFTTLIINLMVIGLSSWRWQQLNRAQGISLSYKRTFLPTYLGIAFNNLLPGGVGGDFFRFYFLNKKITVRKSAVMISILFDRITGLMGIFIVVGLVAILYFNTLMQYQFIYYFAIFCVLSCIGVFVVIHSSKWLSTKFANTRRLKPFLSLLNAMLVYRNAKLTLLKCLLISLVIQLFIAITCMLIAKMLQIPVISLSDYLIAIAITQIVNLIPIAPGGIGMGEMAFANILALLNPGISATFATILLAYRMICMVSYLPGVGVILFNKRLLKREELPELMEV